MSFSPQQQSCRVFQDCFIKKGDVTITQLRDKLMLSMVGKGPF